MANRSFQPNDCDVVTLGRGRQHRVGDAAKAAKKVTRRPSDNNKRITEADAKTKRLNKTFIARCVKV